MPVTLTCNFSHVQKHYLGNRTFPTSQHISFMSRTWPWESKWLSSLSFRYKSNFIFKRTFVVCQKYGFVLFYVSHGQHHIPGIPQNELEAP